MEEIKLRLGIIRSFTTGNRSFGREDFDADTICIQFRKTLESIAFGSLVAHREAYEEAHSDIQTRWRAVQILERIEKVHPKFYPSPMDPPKLADGVLRFSPQQKPFLTRADFETLYDKCGDMLHMWNPFRPGRRVVDLGRPLDEWRELIVRLLDRHVVWLKRPDGQSEGWFVIMSEGDDHKVRAHVFGQVPYQPPPIA